MPNPFDTTNGLVQQYRASLEASGKIDPRSDQDLTVELGDQLRTNGGYDAAVGAHPDFGDQYLSAKHTTDRGMLGEIGHGIVRGTQELGGTAEGLAALGMKAVGADGAAGYLAQHAKALDTPDEEDKPTVEKMGDIQNVGDAVRYGAGKVGEFIPGTLEAIGTAAAGAAAGTAAEPGGGTVAGGVAGLFGKQAVKTMIRNKLAEKFLGEGVTEAAVNAALEDGSNVGLSKAFSQTTKQLAARAAGTGAAYVNAAGMGASGTFLKTGDVGTSLAAGALGGIPGAILPGEVASKFFPTDEVAGNFMQRLMTNAAKEIPMGVLGNAGQEVANIAVEKMASDQPAEWTKEDTQRLVDAGVGGVIGGALGSGINATIHGTAPSAEPEAPPAPPAPDPANLAARRAAASGSPAPAPAATSEPTRGQLMAAALRMAPGDQDARITALQGLSTPTKAEAGELTVLQALAIQRPSTEAKTAEAPPAAAAPAAPAPTAVAAPGPDELGGQPEGDSDDDGAGTTALVAPAPAQTAEQLARRVATAGSALQRLARTAPGLDITGAQDILVGLGKADTVTSDAITGLETSVKLLQQQAVTEVARTTAAKTEQIQKKNAAKLAKATAAATDNTAANGDPTATPPSTPGSEALPTQDTLKNQVAQAIAPSAPGPAATEGFTFGKLTNNSADLRPALDGKTPQQIQSIDWEKLIDVKGSMSDNGNRASTRVAVALQAPDGSVVVRGLTNYNKTEGLRRVGGDNAGAENGPAVQQMGSLKGKLKNSKVVDPSGKQQVLLNDLVKEGYTPLARLNFDGEPGTIAQEFKTSAEFDAAWQKSEPVGAQAERNANSVADQAASDAAAAVDPDQAAAIVAREQAKQQGQGMRGDVFNAGDDAVSAAEANQASGASAPQAAVADRPYGEGPWKVRQREAGGKWRDIATVPSSGNPEADDSAVAAAYQGAQAKLGSGSVEVRDGGNTSQAKITKLRTAGTAPHAPVGSEQLAQAQMLIGDSTLAKLSKKTDGKSAAEVRRVLTDWVRTNAGKNYVDAVGQGSFSTLLHAVTNYGKSTETGSPVSGLELPAGTQRSGVLADTTAGGSTIGRARSPLANSPAGAVGSATGDAGVGAGARTAARSAAPVPDQLSKAFDKVPDTVVEGLAELIANRGDKFDDHLLRSVSAGNQKVIANLLERSGMEWPQFSKAIQDAYTQSDGDGDTFASILRGDVVKERVDQDQPIPVAQRAQDEQAFRHLVARLGANGFDVELLQKELGGKQSGFISGRRIGILMDDVANANLTNLVALLHEAGHAEIGKLGRGMQDRLSQAVDNTIAEVKDGNLVKAAANANDNWEEKLVETLAIKLGEEGFAADRTSIAAAAWRTIKDAYYKVAMAAMKSFGLEPDDEMVTKWFENNMRRTLGGDYDYRHIDLFRPFIEKAAERVSRFTVIDGPEVANFLDPVMGRMRQPEAMPDTVEGVLWNLDRNRLTRGEGFYQGKKFSDILAAVKPEEPPSSFSSNMTGTDAVKGIMRQMGKDPVVTAADGRRVTVAHGDAETARLIYRGQDVRNITQDQLLGSRAVHLLTASGDRNTPRPEKVAGSTLITNTLKKADLVLETTSTDGRTPDQSNFVYVKLYKSPNSEQPTWHFVRVDQAGRLVSQHTNGPAGGYITPNIESGVVKAAPGEKPAPLKKGGSSSESSPRPQAKEILSEGTQPGLSNQAETLTSIINLVNPSGWSKDKLSGAVMQAIAQGVVNEEEAGPLLQWIRQAPEADRKGAWKTGGGALFREENIGAEEDMDYTEAMARVQSAAWGALMDPIDQAKADIAGQMTEQQFWKTMGRGDLPKDIVAALETKVPGSGNAEIGGDRMTDPMNQRARYQAYRIARALVRGARNRASADDERLETATDAITERSKAYNKLERELRDSTAVDAHLNDQFQESIKQLARDMDRGPDTAFAAGKLSRAIREVEGLDDDEAIPEEYQRVFKRTVDSGGTTLFESISALSRLQLPLARMRVSEVLDAIRENGEKEPALKTLAEDKPLAVAIASLARNSTREMDMLQLRSIKDGAEYAALKKQLDEIRTASDERIDALSDQQKKLNVNASLTERIRGQYLKARRDFRAAQKMIQSASQNADLRRRFATALEAKANELSKDVGAFSNWDAHNGAKYMAMQPGADGTWSAGERTLRMIGPDFADQHEQVMSDIAGNKAWLEQNRDQAGSRQYQEVQRQTDQLSHVDFTRNYEAAHRFWMDKYLQPLGQKFASTGTAGGQRIRQMLNNWQQVMFNHGDEVEAQSRRWTKAMQGAAEAAGFKNPKRFWDEVMNGVLYQIESDPGRDEQGAMREAYKAAMRRLPDQSQVQPEFRDRLVSLLNEHKTMSEMLNRVAEKNGLYVNDPRVKDPLTEKGFLQRHAIKYGWLTASRSLRGEVVRSMVNDMQRGGWTDTMFDELDLAKMGDKSWQTLVDKSFTPGIVRDFVEPFVNKPGKEIFDGAADQDGNKEPISQVAVQELYHAAGGDILKFIDGMFDYSNPHDDRTGLPAFREQTLQRFQDLYKMESRLAAQSGQVRSVYDPFGNAQHRMMDARTNDLIPPEHFDYDIYPPTGGRKHLTDIAYHAAFGRDGNGLDSAIADTTNGLRSIKDAYDLLPAGDRKAKLEAAKARGLDLAKLERGAKDFDNIGGWKKKLMTHFSGKESVVDDARALLELARLNTGLVLNQPKSALIHLLSLAQFPQIYRGLGKTSLKASGSATAETARGIFGSMLEAFGSNFIRASDYAKEVGEVIQHREVSQLPFGTLMADIGTDGEFGKGGMAARTIQGSRWAQQLMKVGIKTGKTGDHAKFNGLWSPFQFIAQQVSAGIATANVQAFESVVKRAVDYYQAHPDDMANPGHVLTAENLNLKEGLFTDQGAFDYFRQRAIDYNIGHIEDIARTAADRMARGERLLDRNQALSAAMMALNEVSLDANVNTRPVEWQTNPILRFGGLLMGWSMARMNQVNDAFKTPEGRLTAVSALKAAGVMAAWSLPAGLAWSLMSDQYDERILGKKSNMQGINPIAVTPVVGPMLAAAGKGGVEANLLGMLERAARSGIYGMGGDALSSLANIVDPTTGQRDFDLNSRVLLYSQYANFRDTVRNLIAQNGEYTYASVGRPLLQMIGGNGVLQYTQVLNHALGLTNQEAEIAARVNVNNWLRAAGRQVGVELRGAAGASSPTAVSPYLTQMQLSAMGNDRVGFLEAYRNAVEVERKDGQPDPENKVLQSWGERNPITSVFRTRPNEYDMGRMTAVMDDAGRAAVQSALSQYRTFTEMIQPSQLDRQLLTAVKFESRVPAEFGGMSARRAAATPSLFLSR